MRLFCRDDHSEPERCPPHEFNAAAWDDVAGSKAVMYCGACGDIRQLEVPTFLAPELESVRQSAEQ